MSVPDEDYLRDASCVQI